MRFRMLPIAIAMLAVVALGGCMPQAPVVTPEPLSSATPVFASDEDALAAATEAYAKYLAAADKVFNAGGDSSALLENVATGELLEAEESAAREMLARQWHSSGNTKFQVESLQSFDRFANDGVEVVTVYVCEDISNISVVDSAGASVVAADRRNRSLFEVGLDWFSQDAVLKVASKTVWSNPSC